MSNTSCKDCVFAEYDEITQVGCSRGMIEKYRDDGASIIEAYDHTKEFFVIEDRTCPFNRTQAWEDRFDEENGADARDEAMNRMLDYENQLSFHVILFMGDSIGDVQETLTSLIFQDLMPVQVTIVRQRTCMITPREVTSLFSDSTPFKWRVENLWKNLPHSNSLHMVQKVVKSGYYITANSGYRFDKGYFSAINQAVIENIVQFAMIQESADSPDGTVIPLGVHEYWHFHGDHNKTITENIREFQCKNPEKKIIFTMKQIRKLQQQK